ncbi:MAG: glycoside hydrolase family 75 protein [Elusimicrobia bacterium]|nr:glycoside hydrolase family 75 protein [Elusimicrobiota bacterium]
MEDDRRIYAAAALVVALAAGYNLFGHRVAPKKSPGPGWFSRISPFGSPPPQEPAPASAVPGRELAPPERMMTNAVTRQFSNPSGGTSGGLAGADSGAPADALSAASIPSARLGSGGDVNLPGGGRAPTSASASNGGPRGAGAPAAPVGGGSAGYGSAAAGGSGSGPGAGGAKSAGASAGSSAGGTASAGGLSGAGAKAGAPAGGPGGGPGIKGGRAGQLSGSSSSGGGGGPPGGDSGGGKGGGVDAKAPEVTGKDMAQNAAKDHAGATKEGEGGAAGATAATASGGAGGTGGTGGGDQAAPAAVIGAPDLGTTTARGGMFRLQPGGPPEVPTTVNITPTGARLVSFTAKMAIDADGSGPAAATDPKGQPRTALAYKDGSFLNPQVVPYIVVPTDFGGTHPDVKLGDYAAVTYGAKTVYAIIGDTGPPGVVGEGSMALASGLGIDPDPVKGGIQRKDVRYVIIPGSKDAEPPRTAAAIAARGKALFDAAGAPVR